MPPRERDPMADALRVGAILAVVLGHWLVVAITREDGELVVGRVLDHAAWAAWATWAWQVMPVFFLVGGYVNGLSWSRALAAGEPWSAWARRRAHRLLVPLLPLVAVWILLAPALLALGVAPERVRLATQAAFLPTWFLGVYLAVVVLVPFTWGLHRRWRVGAVLAFAVLVAVLDAAPMPWRQANTAFVWAAVHQMGHLLVDVLRARSTWGAALVPAGLAGAGALVVVAGYPVSMVAVGADIANNASPPTLALVFLALAQLGLILLVRAPLRAWAARPRVARSLAFAGSALLTTYLWHMTALVAVALVAYPTGIWPAREALDAMWWALRPVWIAACALALAPLVMVMRRFERVPSPRVAVSPARVAIGVVAALVAVAWLMRGGLQTIEGGAVVVGALGLAAWALTLVPWARAPR